MLRTRSIMYCRITYICSGRNLWQISGGLHSCCAMGSLHHRQSIRNGHRAWPSDIQNTVRCELFRFVLLIDAVLTICSQRVMGYIASGKEEGATLHFGGERHGTKGYFIQPTIFTNCKPDMKIMKEEIFGPVAAVIQFKDEEGASFPVPCFRSLLEREYPQRLSSKRIIPTMGCLVPSSPKISAGLSEYRMLLMQALLGYVHDVMLTSFLPTLNVDHFPRLILWITQIMQSPSVCLLPLHLSVLYWYTLFQGGTDSLDWGQNSARKA